MREKESRAPLLVVLGPTGAGKSGLGLLLAERFGGEIVNCDSVQLYRGLDIGSAKLPPASRRGVPHHLIDIAGPEEDVTAGAYARSARRVLGELRNNGRIPVVVGGTGLYLRALLDGLSPTPQRDEGLRMRLRKMTERRPASLQRFLRRYDPAAESRIHANDHQKLIRAVELTLLSGRPATVTQNVARTPLAGFRVLKIGLAPERKALYRRIDVRAAEMFQAGLVEETQGLCKAGVSPQAKSLQSLGYRQALGFLSGAMTVEAAVTQCQTKTRQYAKRQMTWFRQEPEVHWLAGFGDDREVEHAVTELTQTFLRVDQIA